MTTDACLKGESAKANFLEATSSKIIQSTGSSHEAEMHACITNTKSSESLQFAFYEWCHPLGATADAFLQLPATARLHSALVVDNKGLFSQVDALKKDKRKGIYVQILFEMLDRTGTHLFWVNGGHMLADLLTKLPASCSDTLLSLEESMNLGMVRICYDVESYRRSLAKRVAGPVKTVLVPHTKLEDEDPFGVPGRTLR